MLNVGTLNGSDLRLSTNSVTAVTIDGLTQNVDITNDANVGGMFNVVGATTLQSTLEVNGITDLNSNLNVFGPTDLNSTLNVDGAVTIQNTINQTGGGQVSFSGNVDATSGLDVSGQDLTVGAGVSIVAPGSGHTLGTAGADANVLTVEGLDADGFKALCDERGGTVEIMIHCGGLATARGFAYDTTTSMLSEHTCKGANTCAGWNCVTDE